jgi:hypothetical protein
VIGFNVILTYLWDGGWVHKYLSLRPAVRKQYGRIAHEIKSSEHSVWERLLRALISAGPDRPTHLDDRRQIATMLLGGYRAWQGTIEG